MAKAMDWPRHGKLKRNGKPLTVVGEGSVAGIKTYRVKFSPKGHVVDYHKESIVVLGRVYEEWQHE